MDLPLNQDALVTWFTRLGTAALLGAIIGLEREQGTLWMRNEQRRTRSAEIALKAARAMRMQWRSR